jgi:hypothetical protein
MHEIKPSVRHGLSHHPIGRPLFGVNQDGLKKPFTFGRVNLKGSQIRHWFRGGHWACINFSHMSCSFLRNTIVYLFACLRVTKATFPSKHGEWPKNNHQEGRANGEGNLVRLILIGPLTST